MVRPRKRSREARLPARRRQRLDRPVAAKVKAMPRSVAVALVAALALVAAACGGTSRRETVSAYFKQVDKVQRDLRGPIEKANRAYRLYATAATDPRERRALAGAGQTVRKVRSRIRRFPRRGKSSRSGAICCCCWTRRS